VAEGVTYAGATLLGPGRVRDAGHTTVVLGQLPTNTRRLAAAAALLEAAGFACDIVSNVERARWAKLALNCALNPVAALAGVPNGMILEHPEHRARFVAALHEVAAVASACGQPLGPDIEARAVAAVQQTATNRCSMLQDLDRGARTEIAALNSAVVAIAERLGVPVPVNRELSREIAAREGRGVRSSGGEQPC
jgi:2-dehydropantoate 2-reductase